MSLEAACADREAELAAIQQARVPLERTLAGQHFACGPMPACADDIVVSVFRTAQLGPPGRSCTTDGPPARAARE